MDTMAARSLFEFSLNDNDETVADSMVVEESFLHATEQAIDILLVIDNLASMRTELEQINPKYPATRRTRTIQYRLATWRHHNGCHF